MANGLLQFLADPNERANIRQGFMDAVNRGAVAPLLGGGVDMANSLLNFGKAGYGYLGHKAGLLSADQMPELTENPVGGSEWFGKQMQNTGMVSDKRNQVAEMLAGFLPMSPTTSAKAVAAIGMGGMVPGMDAAATVWHGSPHKFNAFDASKIGTGEGAQAYGHGLYLADAPEVAQRYTGVSGRPSADPVDVARRFIGAYADPIKEFKALFSDMPDAQISNVFKAAKSAEENKSLYKVDLPDKHINKMLDWDKPLSQQPEGVQKALQPYFEKSYGGAPDADQKLGIYIQDRMLQNGMAPYFSQDLQRAGVPGIRYLDGGSRGAGQGSSNYVVFPGNEGLLTILERNGQPLK